jgi:hypothetical protein
MFDQSVAMTTRQEAVNGNQRGLQTKKEAIEVTLLSATTAGMSLGFGKGKSATVFVNLQPVNKPSTEFHRVCKQKKGKRL